MENEVQENKSQPKTSNYNPVRVNNRFSLTINFGDSLNLLALLAGFYIIKSTAKKKKQRNKMEKM